MRSQAREEKKLDSYGYGFGSITRNCVFQTQANSSFDDSAQASEERIPALFHLIVMISLRSDGPRQIAAGIIVGLEPIEHVTKIVARFPTQVLSCSLIHIDPVDAWKHLPTAARILGFVIRKLPLHDFCRVRPQFLEIIALEWTCRANNVPAETDLARSLDRQQMCFDHVLNFHAPMEKLVRLHVRIFVGIADRPVVVFLRKKTRG